MYFASLCNRQVLIFKKYIQLDECNNQIIIFFRIPPLDCSQGPEYNSQTLICVYLLGCLHACVLMYLLAFIRVLHLEIMIMCYVFYVHYVFICFNYALHDLFNYNKCMTSPHQSNASCGLPLRFLASPTLVKSLQIWVSPTLDPQDRSRVRSCLRDKSLHFMYIFYFLGFYHFA